MREKGLEGAEDDEEAGEERGEKTLGWGCWRGCCWRARGVIVEGIGCGGGSYWRGIRRSSRGEGAVVQGFRFWVTGERRGGGKSRRTKSRMSWEEGIKA